MSELNGGPLMDWGPNTGAGGGNGTPEFNKLPSAERDKAGKELGNYLQSLSESDLEIGLRTLREEVGRNQGEPFLKEFEYQAGGVNKKIKIESRVLITLHGLLLEERQRDRNTSEAERLEKAVKAGKISEFQLNQASSRIAEKLAGKDVEPDSSLANSGIDQELSRLINQSMGDVSLIRSLQIVERAVGMIEDPEARQQKRKEIRSSLEKLSSLERVDFLNNLFDSMDFSLFIGKMPTTDLVPVGVSFWQVADDLVTIAKECKAELITTNEELAKKIRITPPSIFADSGKRFEVESERAEEIEKELTGIDRGFYRQGIEDYLYLPQTREMILNLHKLPKAERLEWMVRLVGTGIRGGGGALPFVLRAAQQDFGAFTEENVIQKAAEWVAKEGQVRGYFSPEDVHKMVGFFEPEELGYMLGHKINYEVWVSNPESGNIERREFQMSAQHVLAEMYDPDTLALLEANQGLGYFGGKSMKGNILRRAYYKQMGFSYTQIEEWERTEASHLGRADIEEQRGNVHLAKQLREMFSNLPDQAKFPEVVRTNMLSLSEQIPVSNFDLMMGESWWMIQMAEAMMRLSRSDIKLIPLDDAARTEWQGFRKWRADYGRGFGNQTPPAQLLGAITLLPPYLDRIAERAMYKPTVEMISSKLEELNPNISKEDLRFVSNVLEKIMFVDQTSPIAGRLMGQMVMGLGGFEPKGRTARDKLENWKSQFRQYSAVIERLGIKQIRNFKDWSTVEANMSDDDKNRLKQIFNNSGFDFVPLLKRSGMSDLAIQRLVNEGRELSGYKGWELFIESANLNLLDIGAAGYKDEDSSTRYSAVALGATQQIYDLTRVEFVETPKESRVRKIGLPASVAVMTGSWEGGGGTLNTVVDPNLEEYSFVFDTLHKMYGEKLSESAIKIKLEGFLNNMQTVSIYEMAVKLYGYSHLAFNQDLYVEEIDAEKMGAGEHFSVKRITRGDFRRRWKGLLGITNQGDEVLLKEVEDLLVSEGYGFVGVVEYLEPEELAEWKRPSLSDKAVMISDNSTFVPSVITGRENYSNMLAQAKKVMDAETPHTPKWNKAKLFADRLGRLIREGDFSWARLIDGSTNVTANEMITILLPSLDSGGVVPTSAINQLLGEYVNLQKSGAISEWLRSDLYETKVNKRMWVSQAWEESKILAPVQSTSWKSQINRAFL